jgi:predicted transcriptional regulator
MKTRRTQYEIYWEILVFCKKERTFTSIIHHCNLNSKITQEYLNFLMKKNYLSINRIEDRQYYLITDKAQKYISLFSNLYTELFEKILESKFNKY